MKNQVFKSNNTEFIARIMLIVILLIGTFSFTSCGIRPRMYEVYTHEEFAKQIETYQSLHDLYVDTYISFDLDDNDEVSKSVYSTLIMSDSNARRFEKKQGFTCDLYTDGLGIRFLYYLKSDSHEYAYKIKCFFSRFEYNFTENDRIEILSSTYTKCTDNSDFPNDYKYEETMQYDPPEDAAIYNHTYHYSLYVNDLEMCCIHISSIEEVSEAKLNEIIQVMSESLVVMNAKAFFIWREQKWNFKI